MGKMKKLNRKRINLFLLVNVFALLAWLEDHDDAQQPPQMDLLLIFYNFHRCGKTFAAACVCVCEFVSEASQGKKL